MKTIWKTLEKQLSFLEFPELEITKRTKAFTYVNKASDINTNGKEVAWAIHKVVQYSSLYRLKKSL